MFDVNAEAWKPVLGYEGYYEVSNMGRVRSVGRYVKEGDKDWREGTLLKIAYQRNGYAAVGLSRRGRKLKRCNVHRLVYSAFNGPIPEGLVVMHKNDDKTDPRLENLMLGTIQDNSFDMVRKRRDRNQYRDATHCVNGHAFDETNTRISAYNGQRVCRQCERDRRAAKKLAAA